MCNIPFITFVDLNNGPVAFQLVQPWSARDRDVNFLGNAGSWNNWSDDIARLINAMNGRGVAQP